MALDARDDFFFVRNFEASPDLEVLSAKYFPVAKSPPSRDANTYLASRMFDVTKTIRIHPCSREPVRINVSKYSL